MSYNTRVCVACVFVCRSSKSYLPPFVFVTGTASRRQLRVPYGGLKRRDNWTHSLMLGSVPKRPVQRASFLFLFFFFPNIFPYTLLPLSGKTTRPGVVDRNYDLDARCGPSSKPRDEPTQPPWPMLPCCIARASRPVRCRSGRHHSVARICLSCLLLFLCSTSLPRHSAMPCHCYCRVWELVMVGMLRCQARTSWGGRGMG